MGIFVIVCVSIRKKCHLCPTHWISSLHVFNFALSLLPLIQMKTCEQLAPMNEVRELMSSARSYLSEGNLSLAFDLAQEASQQLQQVRAVAVTVTDRLSKWMTEYSDTLSYLCLQAIEIRILFPYLYAHGECATVTLTALYSLHTYNTSIPSHLISFHLILSYSIH